RQVMTIELRMLAWSVALGVVYVGVYSVAFTLRRGLRWALSPRDEVGLALTAVGGRLERALRNFFETFPLFAAAVLAVHFLGRQNQPTAVGAQLYFWGRVVYMPVYATGIPGVRTFVWLVTMAGIVMLLISLL